MQYEWWLKNNEQTKVIPHLIILYFDYEQASTSLQFAFQLVEKWEQLQQTQRKHSAVLKTLSPSILSKWFKRKERKKKKSGRVKQTILRFSSVSRLLSHSSLTTPHGTYTNWWFMQSKFPSHLSVITVWLYFSLLGSDIQVNQLTLRSGADQKALNPENWRW